MRADPFDPPLCQPLVPQTIGYAESLSHLCREHAVSISGRCRECYESLVHRRIVAPESHCESHR